ncbi:MAG: LPS export ABC transporter periplasmic protein LptC [Sulfitobacter sp.]|nr:LPS export ABC transporter periplasmic protein LptC [Sulfitobacter sp.]
MQADSYSRMVSWLKVLLPLMALGLLSTLFLLSRAVDPQTSIPFAVKEIQDRLREQIVTGPFYYGTTPEGDEIAFSAETLTTPRDDVGTNHAEKVDVVMDLSSGGQVSLRSNSGIFDIAGNQADLEGDVVITTSTGYRVTSNRMLSELSGLYVRSPGPVQSEGPFGTLNAGAMVLSSDGKEGGAHLVFTNGVKLVYVPGSDKE